MQISAYTVTGVANGKAVMLDYFTGSPRLGIQCQVSGTVTYTVQGAIVGPDSVTGLIVVPAASDWVNHPDPNLVNATATMQGSYTEKPTHIRVIVTAGTGSVTLRIVEYGSSEG